MVIITIRMIGILTTTFTFLIIIIKIRAINIIMTTDIHRIKVKKKKLEYFRSIKLEKKKKYYNS